ncbi:helix-turn-helix transcriptional regulator [Actinotalea subterranea]|uniref:helix-turn-helix transcriptional regulator n=1 Tax=Actinotalea subterranea TaxID=2607497 RepID=UPI0011EEE8CA|nr:helix-turn-helix transcriptional regulator [Actinotalea subterranea]
MHDGAGASLDALGALSLLADHQLPPLAPHVAELLVTSLGGDPAAVTETARLLSEEQLAGLALLPDPLPAVPALRRRVAPVLASMPDDARRVLLVAAVSVVDRTDVLLRGAATTLDELLAGPAVDHLDLVAGHARIRDPRIRSVVHDDASVAERTAAHRSLAAVHAHDGNGDVATWHRALACLAGAPDVAPPLVALAERMLARGDAVWAQRVAHEAMSHAEGDDRARAVAVAGRAALHAGHVSDAADLLREALRTCEPGEADGLRVALLVAMSHLTGQVAQEIVDRDGSPWSRLVVRVLHAARGEVDRAGEGMAPGTPDGRAVGSEALSEAGHADHDLVAPGTRALANATVAVLEGRLPAILPATPDDGDPVHGAMVGVLRAVALAADGHLDAARCAVVSVLAELAPLPGDRAWAPHECAPDAQGDRERAMTPLVEAHVRLVEAFVEMWAGNLDGALGAITRASLRLPVGLCLHGAAGVVAGRASVLARGERGVLAEALERLVPLPQSPAVRTGILTDRALALLLEGEAPAAAALLDLCAQRTCPGALPLPTLRPAEVRLLAGSPLHRSARRPVAPTTSPTRGASSAGTPAPHVAPVATAGMQVPCAEDLAAALAPGAAGRLAVAKGNLAAVTEERVAAEPSGSPIEQGLTRLVVGRAFARAGRDEEGIEHLRAAEGLLDGAGAGAVARLARRLRERAQPHPGALRVAGAPVSARARRAPAEAESTWADALTEREAEVALVVADGTSNRLAARHLGLSERTVEVHLTSIFRKLGVASRTELALLVLRSERVV